MHIHRLRVLAASALLATTITGQVTSTFSTDSEGWRVIGDNRSAWSGTFGNPLGSYNIDDLVTGEHNYALAPRQYLGDWSSFTPADTLAVDIYFRNSSGGSRSANTYVFRLAGPGGAAKTIYVVNNYPISGSWNHYSTTLDPNLWVLERGTWAALMSSVTSLRISVEYVNGDEVVYMDNVRLSRTPRPVLSRDLTSTFDADLDDWSFRGTGGANYQAGTGNSGGCARIVVPTTPGAVARAPAGYVGDWSRLDGVGRLGLDLRIGTSTGAVPTNLPLVRLISSAGIAEFMIRASDLPLGPRTWKRFTLPLRANAWTLRSGIWAAILADVDECEVPLDVAAGGAVVLLDNFQRAFDTEPAPDEPVRIHVSDVGNGGWIGMVGVASVAHDPLGGGLYGVVDAEANSGGGLWQVPGPVVRNVERMTSAIFDGDGSAFLSRSVAGEIVKRTAAGTVSTWVAGFTSGADDDPNGAAFAPVGFVGPNVRPGDLLVADPGVTSPNGIWVFSRHVPEGERLLYMPPTNMDINDLAAFADGRVFAVDALDGSRILQVFANGTVTSIPIAPSLVTPSAIVADDVTGRLYVCDATSHTVHRVDPSSGQSTLVASGFRGIHGVAPALELDMRARLLYVADAAGNRVQRLTLPAALRTPLLAGIGYGCGASPTSVTTLGDSSAWPGDRIGLEFAPLASSASAFLMLGGSASTFGGLPLPLDLGAIGMTNCFLWTAPDVLLPVPVVRAAAVAELGVPGLPRLIGVDLYFTGLATAPGSNALGVITSRGLRLRTGAR